jgi:multiple sugar transport system substrate-binding protein
MHYNKAIWRERGITKEPANFEEWVEIVKKTSYVKPDGSHVYGFIMPGGGPRIYPTLVGIARAFDGDFISLDYKCRANEPGMVKALTILKDFYDNGAIPKEFTSFRGEETNTWLTGGRVANSLASFGRTRFYNNPENSKFPGEFEVRPMPSSKTVQDKFKVAPINTEFWATTIPANYPKKELAWDFIRFLASKDSTLKAALNGNGPIRSSAYDSKDLQEKLPYAKYEQAALQDARVPLPPFDKASQAMDILAEEVEATMIGLKPPKQALDDTCARVNPLLPKM